MHDTAMLFGAEFFRIYGSKPKRPQIVEIGALNVNGSLRQVAPDGSKYLGIDMEAGPGVDVVMRQGKKAGVDKAFADLAVASSVFEHDPFFWRTFSELCRMTKVGG